MLVVLKFWTTTKDKYLHKPQLKPHGNMIVMSLQFSSSNGQGNLSGKDKRCST